MERSKTRRDIVSFENTQDKASSVCFFCFVFLFFWGVFFFLFSVCLRDTEDSQTGDNCSSQEISWLHISDLST